MNQWTRLLVGVVSFLAGVAGVLIARSDPSTVGIEQWGLVVAIVAAPAVGSFVSTMLDRAGPRFASHALVPRWAQLNATPSSQAGSATEGAIAGC